MQKFEKLNFLNPRENIRVEEKILKQDQKQFAHTTEFVELVYVLEGSSIQEIDGIKVPAKKGDLLFVNHNQVHSFEAKEDFKYVDILFTPSFMSDELLNTESIFEIFSISLFKEFVCEDAEFQQKASFAGSEALEVERIIHHMLTEFERKRTGYLSVLSGYMRVLFSILLRSLKGEEEEQKKQAAYMSNITPDIMEYIDQHCYEKISLADIAQKSFYTPSYFSQVFKKYCGQSLSEYVKNKRITYAIHLLENTKYSVAEISEMVGYNDRAFFYKVFKEVVGKSPSEYRSQLN
ncbi:MAG: AraC family transcriptional regulator [Lachnospiraceae bacterium]|nr:AraC family transcriptional regulator [Lachnospiraceae bacterium]